MKPTFKESSTGVNRAKQFMPFMALKGYFDECRRRERIPQPRHELTEEEASRLSAVVAQLHKGDMVKVTYYDEDAYVTTQGILTEVVPELHYLRIVRTAISFDDILTVSPCP